MHPRASRRRRARVARRDAGDPPGARQGLGHVHRRRTSSPCPSEYRFFPLDGLSPRSPPTSAGGRRSSSTAATSSATRPQLLRDVEPLLNIDHHHDNTRFGTVNHVVARGVVHGRDRLGPDARRSGSTLTPTIAEALYVGLITDTGRFSYENTGPRAHRMAAELIEAGVDVAAIYRQIYEGMPYAQARAPARAALQRSAATTSGRLADRLPDRPRLHRGRRRGELLRGRSSTTSGRSRGPRSPRSSASSLGRRQARPEEGLAAGHRRRRRRLGDRPRPRRRRPPPGGRLHDRAGDPAISSTSCAPSSTAQLRPGEWPERVAACPSTA